MSTLRRQLLLMLVAVQFLTRVPVPRTGAWNDAWLNDCVRHFPLVGALVGTAGAAVLWTAGHVWPATLAALLAVATTAWLTGAFHEDGLADTCDALGGVVSREKALAILKDPRIGSYGALGLMLVTLGRVAALAVLVQHDAAQAAVALVLAHALGRLAPVVVMARLPYGGDIEHAKAKPLATTVRPINLWIALGWSAVPLTLAAAWMSGPVPPVTAFAAALLVAWAMTSWLRRRLGGYTGDTLGATEQVTELVVLLVMAARSPA
jgi:adenosylcobinamide-GDP ribazoletransferase